MSNGEGLCLKTELSGTTQTLLKPPKIAFKYRMQTPLLCHLRLITVSTWLELGLSGKPLIPPSPMNVWLMPAGCHDSKVWFFPLMEMTDDIAPSESWLPFRSLHVALIEADGKCMEVRPEHPPCFTRESQQNSRAQLSGKRASSPRWLCHCLESYCEQVFVMSHLLFPDKQRFNYHRGPDRTLDFHSTKQDIPSGAEDYR